MNPEIRTAKNWYLWLWFSPLLTLPTQAYFSFSLASMFGLSYPYSTGAMIFIGTLSIMIPALWHLVLLFPALGGRTEFIRWHGRQALLLAGLRTALPLATAIFFSGFSLISILFQLAIYFVGNIWAQRQAARGDCALMRWTGHGARLPLPSGEAKPGTAPLGAPLPSAEIETLLKNLSSSEAKRRESAAKAIVKLQVNDARILSALQNLAEHDPTAYVREAARLAWQQNTARENFSNAQVEANALVEIIRFSRQPERRRAALAELERRGMVEAL